MAAVASARSIPVDRARTIRRILADRWAARLVVAGGLVIIASILAIVGVIAGEIVPLFVPVRVERAGSAAFGEPVLGVGTDEYRQLAYGITATGRVEVRALEPIPTPSALPIDAVRGSAISAVTTTGPGRWLLGTADGRVIPIEVTFEARFENGRRTIVPGVRVDRDALSVDRDALGVDRDALGVDRDALGVDRDALGVDPGARRAVTRVTGAVAAGGPAVAAQLGPREIVLLAVVRRKALIGPSTSEQTVQALPPPPDDGAITALLLDARGEELFVGTSLGRLVRYDIRDRASPAIVETVDATAAGAAVTALGFLNGDRTLVVGDASGGVATWQVVAVGASTAPRLVRMLEFERHPATVTAVSVSRRDKGFVTADAAGGVHLEYGTSGRTLARMTSGLAGVAAIALAPKADGIAVADATGHLVAWHVRNPHPEVTLGTLFGKVWYEGYPGPEWVWQSTGGTDDVESKLSLTPLVWGTLKGTFYALLFAVPIALLAALYVSEFMHPDLRASVKPAVEIMAALPSVVLGFLAGLWLAPRVEAVVPGLLLVPPVLTLAILATHLVWRRIPGTATLRPGVEAFVLVPVVALATAVALALGRPLEQWLLAGDYRTWIGAALGLTFDQRNSLVVGLAMGFAVIPIVFTIAEDSLGNVPQHLRAGSLALGATRWQTAIRIVLPTASPGIFSAVMIGFGRAVGETMIVLMATGNTPLMDWNPFSGFRALSANIAVELPEAPDGGTLFRVLFVAALLLFCFTFVVNTVAELVRLRLRRRYQGL